MRRAFLLLVMLASLTGCAAGSVDDIARATSQGTPPTLSPDGNRAFVALAAGSANLLEIWKRDGDTQTLEWAYSWEDAGREAPGTIQAITANWMYAGRIDLTFSDAIRSRWTGTVTQDEAGWHLRTGKITIAP